MTIINAYEGMNKADFMAMGTRLERQRTNASPVCLKLWTGYTEDGRYGSVYHDRENGWTVSVNGCRLSLRSYPTLHGAVDRLMKLI